MIRYIRGQGEPAFEKEHPFAIVTMCVGESYLDLWERMCRPTWERYVNAHRLDLLVIISPLDDSDRARARSPAWQKVLVLIQPWAPQYYQIAWIDADILINRRSPNIFHSVPDPRKVGICIAGAQMCEAEKHIYFERVYKLGVAPNRVAESWSVLISASFDQAGYPDYPGPMYGTGVMVMSPSYHGALLAACYDSNSPSRVYEQPIVSIEIHRHGLVHELSARFNWSVYDVFELHFPTRPNHPTSERDWHEMLFVLRNEMDKAYFLHFAGSMPAMRLLLAHGQHVLEPPFHE